MECIRVLFVGLHRMLLEILIDAMAGQPDLLILGEEPGGIDLGEAVRKWSPNALLVGVDAGERRNDILTALEATPRVKIFAVATRGSEVTLHEVRPTAVPVGELSPRGLLDAIRAAVHSQAF